MTWRELRDREDAVRRLLADLVLWAVAVGPAPGGGFMVYDPTGMVSRNAGAVWGWLVRNCGGEERAAVARAVGLTVHEHPDGPADVMA